MGDTRDTVAAALIQPTLTQRIDVCKRFLRKVPSRQHFLPTVCVVHEPPGVYEPNCAATQLLVHGER